MKITDALLGEHGVFYAQFAALEQDRDHAPVETLRAEAALLSAALVSHAQMEDELLFKRLDARLGAGGGPLTVMRSDHAEIEADLAAAEKGATAEASREHLLTAVTNAREHFAREEMVLFPLAEHALGAEVLRELGAVWAQRRGVSGP
jgi:hemerythrin-like domain-containing protein